VAKYRPRSPWRNHSTRAGCLTERTPDRIRRVFNRYTFGFFIFPALLTYLIFAVYPIFNAILLSFYDWNGISPQSNFVGLDNYITIFTRDSTFRIAIQNTLVWVVLALLVPTSLSLALAVALNQPLFGKTTFRTLFYLPAILASIAVATMWTWIYNPTLGLANEILRSLGVKGFLPDWLGNGRIALYSVFIAYVWQATGTPMILWLAGLQGVPEELIAAARVDGANRLQTFVYVTLPALRHTTIIVISLTIINSLKVFDMIYGMTYGGPGQATNVLATWSYFKAFNGQDFGGGMAVATVLLVITMCIVLPYILWMSRDEMR
jgi:raffinose/stachyose/melibiose transport system permease protein